MLLANQKSKKECTEIKSSCIKEVNKFTDKEYKEEVDKKKNLIEDFVKASNASPQHFKDAFNVLDKIVKMLSKIDCGDTDKKIEKDQEALNKAITKEYGEKDANIIGKLIMALLTIGDGENAAPGKGAPKGDVAVGEEKGNGAPKKSLNK